MTSDEQAEAPAHKLWQEVQRRSAFLFTVCAAFSVASFLQDIRLVYDLAAWLMEKASGIGTIGSVVVLAGELIHEAIAWWRSIIYPPVQFVVGLLGFTLPGWVIDFGSVFGFSFARMRAVAAKHAATNERVRLESEAALERHQASVRDGQRRIQIEHGHDPDRLQAALRDFEQKSERQRQQALMEIYAKTNFNPVASLVAFATMMLALLALLWIDRLYVG